MSRHHTSVANAAIDLANLAREAHALESATKYTANAWHLENMIADREKDIAGYFADLAKLLGFSFAKIKAPIATRENAPMQVAAE
jgi:hypothetical protein